MESKFVFSITPIKEELVPQLSRVLRYCTEFSSRQKLHALWELTDRLNQVPKAAPEVLEKRRRREGIWGVVLWVLSVFVLIPSAMEPSAMTGLLVAGVLGFFLSCAAMRSAKKKLLIGLNLTMGTVLCFAGLLAFEQLKPLLAPGIFCFAAAVWAMVENGMRRKTTAFDRQAQELVRQRKTIANMENMRAEFTEEGMILSDGTRAGEQCFVYDEFLFVGETEELLVPVCGKRAVVLQTKDLCSGSLEQLRMFLKERVEYRRLQREE